MYKTPESSLQAENGHAQFRSYFTPALKSKYLSYELFSYSFRYFYEVVILLRSLSKQSKLFMETLYDEMRSVLACRDVIVIKIQPNLKFEVAK